MLSFPQRLVRKRPFFPFPFDGGASSFFFIGVLAFVCELGAREEICVVGVGVVAVLCPRYDSDSVV